MTEEEREEFIKSEKEAVISSKGTVNRIFTNPYYAQKEQEIKDQKMKIDLSETDITLTLKNVKYIINVLSLLGTTGIENLVFTGETEEIINKLKIFLVDENENLSLRY